MSRLRPWITKIQIDTIQLAIGAGNGKVFCATESGGWVVLSYMDQMEGATIYCWDAD